MKQCCFVVINILVLSTVLTLCTVVFEDKRLYEGSPCQLPDGRYGICRPDCSKIEDRINAPLCGFKRNNRIICCPNPVERYPFIDSVCANRTRTLLEKREANERARQNIRLTEEKELACAKRVKNMTGLERQRAHRTCLIEVNVAEAPAPIPPIFEALPNEHPHMAALGLETQGETVLWYCGGTLIHENFVVTAAHCLYNIGQPQVVRVSGIDLKLPAGESFAIDYDVEKSYIRPDYETPKYYNDIALLRVKRKPSFPPDINPLPACIWTKPDFPKNDVLVMGYGAPSFSRANNEKLYQGNLTILSSENCTESYESFDTLPDGIISSQVCAYDPSAIIDTCEGDSGGPMQFNDDDEFKTPYLLGITSFGVLCLDGNPGVYTRIYSYLSWINDIIGT